MTSTTKFVLGVLAGIVLGRVALWGLASWRDRKDR